jgi:hypothetical protein
MTQVLAQLFLCYSRSGGKLETKLGDAGWRGCEQQTSCGSHNMLGDWLRKGLDRPESYASRAPIAGGAAVAGAESAKNPGSGFGAEIWS